MNQVENEKRQALSSRILFVLLFIGLASVISLAYYRYIIQEDFLIYAQVSCDPESESCFVWQCIPSEDDSCPEDPEEQTWHYKIVYKKASYVPHCDPYSESGCPELSCETGEEACEIIYCSPDDVSVYQDSESCW